MRSFLLLLFTCLFTGLFGQIKTETKETFLPKGFAPGEEAKMENYLANIQSRDAVCITTPPAGSTLRSIAEWEELQALVITWTNQIPILTEIVRYAREEVEVIIVTNNVNSAQNTLSNANVDISSNVTFVDDNFNSIWVRDYGPNTVYVDDVGSLAFVDWIYNRPRPLDDTVPEAIADYLGIDNYCTTQAPLDLVHTGGNYMTDGLGIAFSSDLFLEENDGVGNDFGTSSHSEAEVLDIMNDFMGIETYPLMEALPYDVIHHIDMHMKLLNEETLIVGEYPEGRADGPQIEANIQYILNNYTTAYGDPFKIVRIPMPPQNGQYPDDGWWVDYRTYANAVFVNNTILVPTYEEQYDTTALRIWEENMPGYNVIGINCNDIIPSLGAIHCITKEVGAFEPLWITTNIVDSGCDNEASIVEAQIKHISGIESATLYYKTPSTNWAAVSMIPTATDGIYSGDIPVMPEGTEVSYYIHAMASSGKTITRPMPGADGPFEFMVESCFVSTEMLENSQTILEEVFPNPASAITCIPVQSEYATDAVVEVTDVLGRRVEVLFEGQLPAGASKYFINAAEYQAGTYFVSLKTERQTQTQKLIVK